MSATGIGGLLIGGVMLLTGVGVIASGIDPLELCFKQCDIPKALVALLGPSGVRFIVGAFFSYACGAIPVAVRNLQNEDMRKTSASWKFKMNTGAVRRAQPE